MTTQHKLSLRGVTRRFGSHVAVADFTLDVQAGEFVCIVGPSGCGKSTVLNLIAGLESADAGRIELDARPVTGPGAERGVMFQDYALMP
jgi:NitT/TauT family transport system ATP-binding protein